MFWDSASQIIYRQAKKDLKVSISNNKKLSDVKISVIKELRKIPNKDLLNEKSELEIDILYIELHNIDNFISIRLAFYALVLAIIVLMKKIDINQHINQILWILIFILVSFRYASDTQKNRILYYKFKLNCIKDITG